MLRTTDSQHLLIQNRLALCHFCHVSNPLELQCHGTDRIGSIQCRAEEQRDNWPPLTDQKCLFHGAISTYCLAIGTYCLAIGTYCLAIGTYRLAIGTYCLAIGTYRLASNVNYVFSNQGLHPGIPTGTLTPRCANRLLARTTTMPQLPGRDVVLLDVFPFPTGWPPQCWGGSMEMSTNVYIQLLVVLPRPQHLAPLDGIMQLWDVGHRSNQDWGCKQGFA